MRAYENRVDELEAGRVGRPGGTKATVNSSDFATRGDYDAIQSELELRDIASQLRRAVPPGASSRADRLFDALYGELDTLLTRVDAGGDGWGRRLRGDARKRKRAAVEGLRGPAPRRVRRPLHALQSAAEAVEPEPRAIGPRDGGARAAHGAVAIAGDVPAERETYEYFFRERSRPRDGFIGFDAAGPVVDSPARRSQAPHPHAPALARPERTRGSQRGLR